MDALIGHSGFVGGTLRRQRGFDALYRSTDIETMAGRSFDTIVCAGISATKWQANRDPDADRAAIERLWSVLDRVDCARFVLISTVDVFADPDGVDEADAPDAVQPYGRHRLEAEIRARERFAGTVVLRLPGLVGPGLRKNALFDLAHRHRLEHLDPRARFQFYPMVNLGHDLLAVLESGLDTVHLTAAPLLLGAIARDAFAIELEVPETLVDAPVPRYDLRSRHAARLGGDDGYTYSARESMLAIRAYAQAVAHAADGGG
jgi:nucleoside-diphosphate-sugar epimerase